MWLTAFGMCIHNSISLNVNWRVLRYFFPRRLVRHKYRSIHGITICIHYSCYSSFSLRLSETGYPHSYYARSGVYDMIRAAGDKVFFCIQNSCLSFGYSSLSINQSYLCYCQVLPVIPQLILPIKNAFNTGNMSIVLATLAALRLMVNAGMNVLTALIDITQING